MSLRARNSIISSMDFSDSCLFISSERTHGQRLLAQIILILAIAILDYITGYEIAVSVFYLIPICDAVWYLGRRVGLTWAILSGVLLYATDHLNHHVYQNPLIPFWNTGVRLSFLILVMLLLDSLQKALREKEKAYREMQKAFDQMRTIKGIIPVCHDCRRIRDDRGYWDSLETFVRNQSDAEFTSSLCPDCVCHQSISWTEKKVKKLKAPKIKPVLAA